MSGNMEMELSLCGYIPADLEEVLEVDNDYLLEIIDGWFLQISLCGYIPAVLEEVLEVDNDYLLEIIDGWFLQIS